MIHVVRRFLPLLLGAVGGLLGSVSGLLLHQLLSRGVRYFWAPWLGWRWVIGLLAYPALGMLIAIPFVYAYPGPTGPWRSGFARAQDLHLRTWLAVFVAAYVPVGFGLAYHRWWGAPAMPLPFTDSYLYAGTRGDLLTAMVAVAVLAPFCAAGVERLLRGAHAVVTLLFGPPLAVALTMGGVLGAELVAGSVIANWPTPPGDGDTLQPLAMAGWDVGLMLAVDTVVVGALAGALATVMIGQAALSGVEAVQLPGSRLRWGLALLAVGTSGVLAVAALAQGFGLDSVRGSQRVLRPGQTGVTGTLVAAADQDVLTLRPVTSGFHLLEFPDPAYLGRHWASVPGYALPSARQGVLRYLVEFPDGLDEQELLLQPTWPLKAGVVDYGGPMRFERIPQHAPPARDASGEPTPPDPAPVVIDVGPGEMKVWDVDLAAGPRALVVDGDTPVELTLLSPRLSYVGEWTWSPSWSVVMVELTVGDNGLGHTVLGDEGMTVEGLTMAIGDVGPGEAPEVRVTLAPAAREGERLRVPVVARGLDPGEPLLVGSSGPTVVTTRDGVEARVVPEPGGAFARVRVASVDGPVAPRLQRRDDGGRWTPVDDEVLLLGELALRVDGERPGRSAAIVLGNTGASAGGYGRASWSLESP